MLDILIKGGTIVDGTGCPAYRGDHGIVGDRIAFIGTNCPMAAKKVIDAEGLLVTPGFVDSHSHGDDTILLEKRAVNQLLQGVTTEITGNCGISVIPEPWELFRQMPQPVSDSLGNGLRTIPARASDMLRFIERQPKGVNMAFLIGHGTIRSMVMGYDDRKPATAELDAMKALLREAMEAGAIGMSSGLVYPPGVYADTDELIELCRVVAAYGGIYTTHMRNEADGVVASVQETIQIAEEAGIPTVISHHKICGKRNWGRSEETTRLIREANARGAKIRCDQYPYNASETTLISVLPPRFVTGGRRQVLQDLHDPAVRRAIRQVLESETCDFENMVADSGFESMLVAKAPETPAFCGLTLAEAAARQHKDPYDMMFDLLIANHGDVFIILFEMCEEDIRRIMACPFTMGGSDSNYTNGEILALHPRYTGTFPRILSHYVRDQGVCSLEEAIRKLTFLPANMAGLSGKGRLCAGYDADITVLDYPHLRANASFSEPAAGNEGIKFVFVNGQLAVENDAVTGALAGRVLKNRSDVKQRM